MFGLRMILPDADFKKDGQVGFRLRTLNAKTRTLPVTDLSQIQSTLSRETSLERSHDRESVKESSDAESISEHCRLSSIFKSLAGIAQSCRDIRTQSVHTRHAVVDSA